MVTEAKEFASPRRQRLARMVADRGFVRVSEASLELGVSEVTVRSDLAGLEEAGAIVRVHGGAMAITAAEPTLESSLGRDAVAKAAIGRAAAALVSSGQAIYVDAGSTAMALAHALVERPELRDLVVVTPGLTIALALESAIPRFSVLVTGGTLRPLQHSLVNPFAMPMLDALNLDIAFLGCNGIHPDSGVTNLNLPEAEIKSRVMTRAKRSVVLADAAKLGRVEVAGIAPLAAFDTLVTDGEFAAPGLTVVRA